MRQRRCKNITNAIIIFSIIHALFSVKLGFANTEEVSMIRYLQTSTILSNDPDLSTFFDLYTNSGISDVTSSPASIVAPVNDAFTDQILLMNLNRPDWIAHLRSFIQFHLTDSSIGSTAANGSVVIMENGESVTILTNTANGQISLKSAYSSTIVNVTETIANSVSTVEIYKTDGILEPSFLSVGLFSLGDIYSGFSILYELVSAIGLSDGVLSGISLGITLFAPTDEAFLALGEERLSFLRDPANKGELQTILTNHVLFGLQPTDLLQDGTVLSSFGGFALQVERSGDIIRVNGATIVQPDLLAKDGIVHGIDRVFISSESVTTSPTTSPISQAPILPTTPAPNVQPTTSIPSSQPVTSAPIPGQSDGDLDTLINDVESIGLNLAIAAPYTLFAPDNTAFAAMNSTLLGLLRSPNWIAHYRDLLLFHVSVQPFSFANLTAGQVLDMENGETVQVNMDDTGNLFLSSEFSEKSTIIEGDAIIDDDGSYTHKIDSVLLPSFAGTNLFSLRDRYDGFGILFDLIDNFGLGDISQFGAYWTIFAPTDEAFLALGNTTLEEWKDPANIETLIRILTSHVLPQLYPSDSLSDGSELISIGGLKIEISMLDGEILANDAIITRTDLLANDGIVHVIDRVLLADTNSTVDNINTILNAESDLSVFTSVGPLVGYYRLFERQAAAYTVFAPVDSAFDSFDEAFWSKLQTPGWRLHLRNLLNNHLIDGEFVVANDLKNGTNLSMRNKQMVSIARNGDEIRLIGNQNEATVITTDLVATAGVVHKVDTVLLSPFYTTYLADLRSSLSGFDILFDLIDRIGLGSELNSVDATILAPTDDAFLAIGTAALERLIDPDNIRELQQLLSSHVIPTLYPRESLTNGETYLSLGGLPINVTKFDKEIRLNDAKIVRPDVIARNGIAHGIDKVLGLSPLEVLEVKLDDLPDISTFASLYFEAGLNATVSRAASFTVFAPTNTSFTPIESYLTKLRTPNWIMHLRNLLDTHATETQYYLKRDLTAGTEITMRNGEVVQVNEDPDNNSIFFSSANTRTSRLVDTDIVIFKGTIQTIDTVLFPSFFNRGMGDALNAFPIFADLFARSGLEDILVGDFTILALTDETLEETLGLDKLDSLKDDADALDNFLGTYIVDGVYPSVILSDVDTVTTIRNSEIQVTVTTTDGDNRNNGIIMFDDVTVVTSDILFGNGIVHSIDKLLNADTIIQTNGESTRNTNSDATTHMPLMFVITVVITTTLMIITV